MLRRLMMSVAVLGFPVPSQWAWTARTFHSWCNDHTRSAGRL